jgi:hypothetical protein
MLTVEHREFIGFSAVGTSVFTQQMAPRLFGSVECFGQGPLSAERSGNFWEETAG